MGLQKNNSVKRMVWVGLGSTLLFGGVASLAFHKARRSMNEYKAPYEAPEHGMRGCLTATDREALTGSQGDLKNGPVLIPEHGADGIVTGARVYGIRLDSSGESLSARLARAGVKNGDLLESIQGNPWESVLKDPRMRELLATQNVLELRLRRGDTSHTLMLTRC